MRLIPFLAPLMLAVFSSTAWSQTAPANLAPAASCESLKAATVPDVRVTEAVLVTPAPQGGPRVPHCRVTGVIGKEIKFLALLPTGWNGRFLMGGGGGFVGTVNAPTGDELTAGYATAGTDTGHEGSAIQAGWALGNEERRINYGYLAVHRTAETVKALIRAYYGRSAEKSYFLGCSNGGRQAMMEAQRYPDDFDGIVAGAPAFNFTEVATSFIKNMKAAFPDPAKLAQPSVSPAALKMIETKVLAACDAKDGVADGVLDDPRACDFKLAAILPCPNDQPGDGCLTKAERAAVEMIYRPIADRDGLIYPGQPFGSEGEGGGWPAWITGSGTLMPASGSAKAPSAQWAFGTEFFKYLVFGDSTWNYLRYDLSRARTDLAGAGQYLNAVNLDLDRFTARGGKLILWHGWSDPALNALATIHYYQQAIAGQPKAAGHLRLFLLPGVLHCAGGAGPDRADWPTAIADWVEHGKAPARIVASKMSADRKPIRTRPLCPYPEVAVWKGKGGTDDEASFACRSRGDRVTGTPPPI